MRIRVLAFVSIVIAGVWWFTRRHETSSSSSAPHMVVIDKPVTMSSWTPPQEQVQDAKAEPQVFQKSTGKPGATRPFPPRRPASNGHDSSPMDRYQGLQQSGKIQINGRDRTVLGARAVPTKLYDASFGPTLFEENGYSIVGLNSKTDGGWPDMAVHEDDKPVLLNPNNGRIGIVTGTIIVKFNDVSNAQAFAQRQGLTLMGTDAAINTGYFHAPNNYALLGAPDALSKDPDVQRVELEVVENFKGVR